MHYLFRLENYEHGIKEGKFVERVFLNSLAGKISDPSITLLFGDTEKAEKQAYDELVAIIGGNYKIGEDLVFLGETVFLQEYLGTSNCFLCYGHSTRFNSRLSTLEIIEEIINLDGIKGRIAVNNATGDDFRRICDKSEGGGKGEFLAKTTRKEEKSVSETDDGYAFGAMTSVGTPPVVGASQEVGVSSVPRSSDTGTPPSTPEDQEAIPAELKAEIANARYQILDVPSDGNCGIWAVLVAAGEISLGELKKLMNAYEPLKKDGCSPNWRNPDCQEALLRASPTGTERMLELRAKSEVGKAGDWVDNNDHLPKISETLGKPIVLITTDQGQTIYTLYSSTETKVLEGKTIEQITEDVIFIYYAHNHYQAVIPQGKP